MYLLILPTHLHLACFLKFKYCEVPGSNFIQKEIILETFKTIMEKETYQPLHTKNSLICAERDDQFNEELSKISVVA